MKTIKVLKKSSATNSNILSRENINTDNQKLLTYFEALIKVGVCAYSFFSIKNTKSSELEFQHSATKHALQMNIIY